MQKNEYMDYHCRNNNCGFRVREKLHDKKGRHHWYACPKCGHNLNKKKVKE